VRNEEHREGGEVIVVVLELLAGGVEQLLPVLGVRGIVLR